MENQLKKGKWLLKDVLIPLEVKEFQTVKNVNRSCEVSEISH